MDRVISLHSKLTRTISMCLLMACSLSRAQESGPAVMGWRGDGNGHFPKANPPLDWGRVAKTIQELSSQSRKPKDGETPDKDSAMPDGVLRKWLVLGPLP